MNLFFKQFAGRRVDVEQQTRKGSSNCTSRAFIVLRFGGFSSSLADPRREIKSGAVGTVEADGRPAVYGGALPLRLQKERAFFPTFGDEERLAFFLEPKGFGFADGWPASGRPAGGGAGVGALRRRWSTVCWQAVWRNTERQAAQQDTCERAAQRREGHS